MQKIVYFHTDNAYVGTRSIIKFCTFDCYDILPALKQEGQFDAHEFHLALVLSLMSKADAQ